MMGRYAGTTVDPNFANIAKLPRKLLSLISYPDHLKYTVGYAKFGKISASTVATDAPVSTPEAPLAATDGDRHFTQIKS